MKLIQSGLELGIFCDILFEDVLILRFGIYREITGLGVPVSLGFRRNQELYEFPYSCLFDLILIIQSPERSAADRHAALIAIGDRGIVSGSDLKASIDILKILL